MKSRIHKIKEYQAVDFSAFRRVFHADESLIQNELQRLQNRGIRWEDGIIAAEGDAATCSLESENPRFHKPMIPIAVGAGMLPAPIEQAIVGMQVGAETEVEVDGQPVRIRLLRVKNKRLPELTDAWIAGVGMEGITTVDQFRDHLIRQQKEERAQKEAYQAAEYVMTQVRKESEFILCQQDWDAVVGLGMARHAELCRQDGLDIKTMTAQDFRGRIPVNCYEGVESLVKTDAWRTLQNYLLGRHYAALDGYIVDESSYEAYIRNYQKFWRVSEENARLSNTYDFYCINTYATYFVDKVIAYVRDNIYLEC